MAFVVKIKFENTLRRLTAERDKDGSLGLTFISLIAKIRDMFKISPDERLVLTYVDQDSDLVTMRDDDDLYDALIIQSINPLRINVSVGDLRIIKERKAAFDKSLTPKGILKSHENPSHLANDIRKEVESMLGNWCSVQDAMHAYKPSVQMTSKRCTIDDFSQRILQISHRQEDYDARCNDNGKARWHEQSLRGCKHHHRMKRSFVGGSSIGKLDARFVCDVTIFDGTELVCGTHFTKIWRLRNIGTCAWPPSTLLVYTGGDLLGTKQSALIELPEKGLPCEEEMNVAVDFVAPESPGRYVSHWRLRAPSGQKFGQRVWVLIKAVAKCVDSDIPNQEKPLHQEPIDCDINNDLSCTHNSTSQGNHRSEA